MKLNPLSLTLAVTLAIGSSYSVAHAETAAASASKVSATTSVKTDVHKNASAAGKNAAATKATKTESTNDTLPKGIYKDTKDNWARDAIQSMTQAGYLSGYSDNTFKPNQTITREQAAAIYDKVLQDNLSEQELSALTAKETRTYTDVEAQRWSNEAIRLVSAAGILEGTSNTAFSPAKAMNREEFVASAAGLAKTLRLDAPDKTEKVTFKDSGAISKAYASDIDYMAQKGYVSSGAAVDFNPKQPVTRAQAATILYRMLNGFAAITETETDSQDLNGTAVDKKAAAKAEKDAKAAAKKAEKAAKSNKNDALADSKTEQSRSVRTVRRSTVKPLNEKQQTALENKVFTELNKTYKTDEEFQNYGVMYWRDNQLHVALKTGSDIPTVKANLAALGDSTVNNYVIVEPSQYSQVEYDAIDANFRNYYSRNEKAGTILATFPDVENNQLYAVVSTASKETQQNISRVFGSKVKMTVKR